MKKTCGRRSKSISGGVRCHVCQASWHTRGNPVTGNVQHMAKTRDPHDSHRSVAGGLARAAVFGISDGLVSNVSLVLGFAGGGVNASVVRLAGLAGLVAGATSMAAGEWISVSAQNELIKREVELERNEIINNAETETQELAYFYEQHGMSKDQALISARQVMTDTDRAVVVHTREEMGVDPDDLASPLSVAAISFLCFALGAFIPVIPWFIGTGTAAALASLALGAVSAAVVGTLIGVSADRPIPRTALRQVLILLVACGVTFLIGSLLNVTVS
jgi:vacuolar iron transporter family protein